MRRTQNNERLIQTPRRRYKPYGDPENAGMDYPRTTARRLSLRDHHEVNMQQERQALQSENQGASDSEDELRNSSHNESDNSDVVGDENESEGEEDMELQTASTTGSDSVDRNSGAGVGVEHSSSDDGPGDTDDRDSGAGVGVEHSSSDNGSGRHSREAGKRGKAADRCYQIQGLHHLPSANNRSECAEEENSDNEPHASCLRSEADHCLTTADGGSECAEQLRDGCERDYGGDQERDRESNDTNESEDEHRH